MATYAVNIWKFLPPLLLSAGTFGNLLTILVLIQRKNRSTPTARYLTALAVTDLLVLWTGLLRQWMLNTFDTDVRTFSNTGCKLHVFLVYVGTQCSSWLLVAVTTERFVGIWFPHRFRGCTSQITSTAIAVIVICIMTLNVHWFYGFGIITTTTNNVTDPHTQCCSINDHYEHFIRYTWPWIDLCVFCFIPFTILLVENSCIIAYVLKTRKQVSPFVRATAKKSEKAMQVTATLVTLNVVFFICILPISIFHVGYSYWMTDEQTTALWWAIVNILMYLNNTLNCLLYFLSGSRFQEEVKALLSGKRSLIYCTRNTS